MRLLPDGFDSVDELYAADQLGQLVVSVEAAPTVLCRLGEFEDHGERRLVGEASLGSHGTVGYSHPMTAVDEPQTAAEDGTDPIAVDDFIGRWGKSGGAESANFQTFANELCNLLGVPKPDPAQERVESNDYVFERRVDYKFDDGTTARRRIDLYKRDRFVMEAKQSAKRVAVKKADPCQPDLIPEDATQVKAGTATRGTGRSG